MANITIEGDTLRREYETAKVCGDSRTVRTLERLFPPELLRPAPWEDITSAMKLSCWEGEFCLQGPDTNYPYKVILTRRPGSAAFNHYEYREENGHLFRRKTDHDD